MPPKQKLRGHKNKQTHPITHENVRMVLSNLLGKQGDMGAQNYFFTEKKYTFFKMLNT